MDRLGGPSSYTLSRLLVADFFFFLVAGAGVLVQVFSRPQNPPPSYLPVFFCILAIWGAAGLLIIVLLLWTLGQGRRELRRGYTYASRGNLNAAQLEPRTGVVLREPAEPFLDSAELRRRTRAVREWAREEGA